MTKLPKRFLSSKYRKEMWRGAEKILDSLKKVLSISSVHVLGSFTTNKTRPADVDFVVFVKTKDKKNKKWAVDMTIAPDNKYGKLVLKDADRWVKEKYGLDKSTTIKVK